MNFYVAIKNFKIQGILNEEDSAIVLKGTIMAAENIWNLPTPSTENPYSCWKPYNL